MKSTGNSCQLPEVSAVRHQQQLEPVSVSQAIFGCPVPQCSSMGCDSGPACLPITDCYPGVFPKNVWKVQVSFCNRPKPSIKKIKNTDKEQRSLLHNCCCNTLCYIAMLNFIWEGLKILISENIKWTEKAIKEIIEQNRAIRNQSLLFFL